MGKEREGVRQVTHTSQGPKFPDQYFFHVLTKVPEMQPKFIRTAEERSLILFSGFQKD